MEQTTLDRDVENIVNTIINHENIPRKKNKFVNFIKNIMRNKASASSIDKTWDLFSQAQKLGSDRASGNGENSEEAAEKEEVSEKKDGSVDEENMIVNGDKKSKKKKKKDKSSKQDDAVVSMEVEVKEIDIIEKKKKKGGKNKENVEQTVDLIDTKTAKKKKGNQSDTDVVEQCIPELKKKSKKRKRDVVADESVDDSLTEVPDSKKTKFEWDEVMVTLLEKQDDSEMSLKKLKKKCIAEFLSRNEGTHKTKEELGAKFDKKLKKRKYIVLKDRVKLRKDEEEVGEKIVQVM